MIEVSVIIPTLGSKARAAQLWAAIESLSNQDEARVIPIVVVNGSSFAPEVVEQLQADHRVRYLYRAEGSAPLAVAAGRESVATEFFGILDDDDIYLPAAIRVRVTALQSQPSVDAVVTNGLERIGGIVAPWLPQFAIAASDPLGVLMEFNWLASAAGLFRSQSVGPEVFADAPRVVEWTYIALRLALTRKLLFLDIPTFEIRTETPASASKSKDYLLQNPAAIRKMLGLQPPPRIQKRLRRKLIDSLHQISTRELADGNLGGAWLAHFASLGSLYGLRYLSYTRHLLRPG